VNDTQAQVRTARRIAAIVIGATAFFLSTHFVLGWWTGSLRDQGAGFDLFYEIALVALSAVFAVVGWAIVTRLPRNTIGWLLLAIPLVTAFGFAVGDYATAAFVPRRGALPFGRAAAWADRWVIVVVLSLFIPMFLLFPDGRIPSRRWRLALWLTVAAPTITAISFALTPGRMTGSFSNLEHVTVVNPLGIEALRRPLDVLTKVGGFATLLGAILAGIAIVVRFRSSSGEVRQQIKWLAFVGVAFLVEFFVGLGLAAVLGNDSKAGDFVFLALFLTLAVGIPLACGIAILKYRLYDLDVVIRKTLVFTIVAGVLTALYLAILALSTVGRVSRLVVGMILLAVTFGPVRAAARSVADRLVYGRRASAYEVLTEFSGRVGDTYATEDVLPRMAQILASGTGATSARILLRVGDEPRAVASFGEPGGGEEHVVPVADRGEELGGLAVTMPPSDPMDPSKEKLVRDLASQAGLVLRNVRLIEELRASRQRLVTAQDEERRRIERNIHDGAQQQLVALSIQLKLAEQLVGKDADKERALLAKLGSQAAGALEDLRALSRGIYPPLLADRGLTAALEAQARKAAVPTTIHTGGIGRYDRDVESAVYFCTLEALNNVAKYADASTAAVRLTRTDGHLTFEVTDDGRGFDPAETGYGTGLQGMADRLEAIGGELRVSSAPGEGTTVRGRVPAGGSTS
jgi:signal transduction histidine kinase